MNLVKRTVTAAVLLGVLFLVVQYAPDWAFFLFGQAFIVAALLEFYGLAAKNGLKPRKVLGVGLAFLISLTFYFRSIPLEAAPFAVLLIAGIYFVASINTAEKLTAFPAAFAITMLGVLYVAFPLNFLYRIRLEMGPLPLYFLFAVIFLGDTGAFFIGKPFGRHKMTPIASPNKSWEGSAGGILFALAAAALSRWLFLPEIPLLTALLTAVVVHAAAQVSDPLESLFKRAVGVKDSSNALPGHGGFFDRIDSLILAGPLFYFIVRYLWK
jgi:phosphatidate cytidylyltransferase